MEASGQSEVVQCADPVSLFLDLYLPARDTAVLRQVCAGLSDGSHNGGMRPGPRALDRLCLGSRARVYLPARGTSSTNVVFESATVPFNFLKTAVEIKTFFFLAK